MRLTAAKTNLTTYAYFSQLKMESQAIDVTGCKYFQNHTLTSMYTCSTPGIGTTQITGSNYSTQGSQSTRTTESTLIAQSTRTTQGVSSNHSTRCTQSTRTIQSVWGNHSTHGTRNTHNSCDSATSQHGLMKLMLMLCLSVILLQANAQKTIIHCGQLVDVRAGSVLKEMSIIIESNLISDVVKGYVVAAKSEKVIDLKNRTVMPGLIDSHVHLETETNPNQYSQNFSFNPADYAFQSVGFANKTLLSGFTTVRDLGGSNVNIALRNAINKRIIIGPRVYTAGRIIATTGGHGDRTNNYRSDIMGDPGPLVGVINGVEDARKAVRQRYKEGADLIKVTASGGVLSVAKSGENPQFTVEELEAVVATAKDYGFKVAAHCHGAEAMKRAVLAGVNSVEHGTYMTEEIMEIMKTKGTWYVPTITAGKSVADSAKKPGYYPDLVTPKALAIGPKVQNTFSKAYKAGVKIAFGTDAGVFAHGKNWLEFVYMNEGGMPGLETIKAATLNAAELIGVSDIIGSIEKGKLADIVAVDGDPSKDIQSMGRMKFVMKDGVVFKNE